MTGLYPHRHGITYNVRERAAADRGLDPKLPVTETDLAAAGYACAQRGKWHLGEKTTHPRLRATIPKPTTPRTSRPRPRGSAATSAHLYPGGPPGPRQARIDVVIAKTDRPNEHNQETCSPTSPSRQMEKMASKPFFLTVSLPAPHAPWAINDPYYSMYERSRIPLPENRRLRRARGPPLPLPGSSARPSATKACANTWASTTACAPWWTGTSGRLLDALKRLNLERNTLTIFVADHGDMQAGHGMYGKTNFSIYEETTRIPAAHAPPRQNPRRARGRNPGRARRSPPHHPRLPGFPGARGHPRPQPAPLHGRQGRPRPPHLRPNAPAAATASSVPSAPSAGSTSTRAAANRSSTTWKRTPAKRRTSSPTPPPRPSARSSTPISPAG